MHQVEAKQAQLHDEVCVVNIGAFTFPGALMVQVPQVDGVPANNQHTQSRSQIHPIPTLRLGDVLGGS